MLKRSITFAMLLCVVTILLSALSLKTVEAKTTTSNGKVSQSRYASNTCGQWSVVPSPDSNGNTGLSDVAAVSANDVWAVGSNGSQMGRGQTVIEHWNGKKWTVVKSPSPNLYNTLTSVSVVSASDVWAAGWQANGASTQTLIEHWNGTQWSVVKSPSPASINNQLYGVTAVSATDVWAVGSIANNTATGTVQQTLIEHWNGTKWSVVKSPNPGPQVNGLSGVSAVSATDVWAVGYYENSSSLWLTLTEHWNGTQWSVVKSPSPGTVTTQLSGVTAISSTDVWATGHADSNTLTEHYC